jgi:hypothetical protein
MGGSSEEGGPPSRGGARAGWLRRLYLTLRTEHTSPRKLSLAVALGVFIGFTPFWGVHLALAVLVASLLRLNRLVVYAAANVANPITVAPIVFAEVQVGHRLLEGSWLPLRIADVKDLGLAGLLWVFVFGSLLVGLAAAVVAWGVVYPAVRIGRRSESWIEVADRVSLRYLDASVRDAEASRSSLLKDPIYPFLLAEEPFARAARILDLGCGRGVLAALCEESGVPVGPFDYLGVDRSERYIRVARLVLGSGAGRALRRADLRDFDPPVTDVAVLVDTLRFLPASSQDALLRRLGKAMPAGSRLYLREVDRAAPRFRFLATLAADALAQFLPGRSRHGLHYRRADDLRNALAAAGFETIDRSSLSGRNARVLFEAVRPGVPEGVAEMPRALHNG